MAKSIYITSAEGNTGKSSVALGVLEILSRSLGRVAVFRPVARSREERDYVLKLLLAHDSVDLQYNDCIGVGYDDVHADPEAALTAIVEKYRAVETVADAVLIVGSDYTDVSTPTELSFNARVAANLGAPVLLVLGGRQAGSAGDAGLVASAGRSAEDMRRFAEVATQELRDEHAQLLGIIVNRADGDALTEIAADVAAALPAGSTAPVWTIPEDRFLVAPTVRAIMESCEGTMIKGDPQLLSREALGVVIAGMTVVNVLPRLTEGAVVLVPGDRVDVLLAALMAHASVSFPSLSGIILIGGFALPEMITDLINGLDPNNLPIITTQLGTFETALRLTQTRGRLAADSQRKRDTALALFDAHVDGDRLLDALEVTRSSVVTPLMFEYDLIERARANRKRIVLPEGDDDRILRAASTLLSRKVVDLTILGEPREIAARAAELGIDLTGATLLSPLDPELRERFATEYAALRAHKGMSLDLARDIVTDVAYFGTMMVQLGLADGMVSGAAHTTAHTVRPAFEIIKTRPGVSIVSSVFFMALADRVLVYGDCAVVPDPTVDQLADIAISSADTAARFGIEPRVAMLSYSTGASGTGVGVDKVRDATARVRALRPELPVEGPIQYDAAADIVVAHAKLPNSPVAGTATVFIFPDLNTGNNTYKAVQRSAGAVAIGPVLQGLRKPINDLSRGALVDDIVNTVAITAIQAQEVAAS